MFLTREERVGCETVLRRYKEAVNKERRSDHIVLVELKRLDHNTTYVLLPLTGIRSAFRSRYSDHFKGNLRHTVILVVYPFLINQHLREYDRPYPQGQIQEPERSILRHAIDC